jgi:hypothetical protein
MTNSLRTRTGHTSVLPAVVRTLIAFYGTPEAVEDAGVAYRLFGEWIVLESGRNIVANLRLAAV